MYADTITESMRKAIDETNRRRERQMEHNKIHGIIPTTVKKAITDIVQSERAAEEEAKYGAKESPQKKTYKDLAAHIKELEKQMYDAASELNFELAAKLRDEIQELREEMGLLA